MKKLISLMGLAAVVLFGFTSCDKEKPKFTTDLNTGHSAVGKLYGMDRIVDDPKDAQGIIFAVSPDGKTAYLVAFTDLMEEIRFRYQDPVTGRLLNAYATYAAPTAWSKNSFEAFAKDKDGEVNTERIIAADTSNGGTAAQKCRNYYKRSYRDTVEQSIFDQDTNSIWVNTKGKWYLPSMEELAALMKVRDKINQKYLQGVTPSDVGNGIYFQAIGDKFNLDPDRKPSYAYWSSTEYNEKYAWYDLPASNADSYIPKTWSDERGNGRLYVRPIRKVELQ